MAAQCVVGALLFCAIGAAQPPQPAPAAETAPVVLDGVTLFRVRGVSSFPAERRAAGIAERIETLADNPKYTTGSLRIVQEATHSNIVFEETVVTPVTDLDAAQEGIPVPLVAQTMVRAIDEGVTRYRAERSPAQLRRDAFVALGITLAFLVAGYIFLRLFRFVESYFERVYQARISKLGEQTRAIVEAGALRDSVLNTLRVLRVAILCGGVLIWLNLVLGSFPWTRPFSQRVVQLLVDPLTAVGLGVIAYVPNLAFLIVLFFVIRLALRLTELFFNAVATGTIDPDAGYRRAARWLEMDCAPGRRRRRALRGE